MSQADKNLRLPGSLYLETTSRCNLRCRGCILFNGRREPERDLLLRDAAMITDQLPDLQRATLHGVGEPLLNPHLPAIIRHLKKRNIYTLFNSNGILLDNRRRQELIDSGLDELRISLDAASPAGYEKVRDSRQFDRIVRNLRAFRSLQAANSSSRPRLSLWFLGTKDNIRELPEFVKLAADIGIPDVYLQRLVYYQDDQGYGLAKKEMSLQDADDGHRQMIRQSQQLAEQLGLRFNASGMCRPLDSIQGGPAQERPWSLCYRPQTLIYVTAAGNVLPCCIAPFATTDYASLVLGNVFETSLQDIWHGPKYENFRKQLNTAAPPVCCRGCGVLWSL